MRTLLTNDEITLLAAVRGTFTESKREKNQRIFFTHFFLIGCPAIFMIALLSNNGPHLPLNSNQWTLAILVPTSILLGTFMYCFFGQSYIFNGTTIRQVSRKGRVWKEIEIQKLVAVTFEHDRWTQSLLLRTDSVCMRILLSPDLMQELQRLPKKPHHLVQTEL